MSVFRFKQFEVDDCGCGMKVGTDSVLLGAWADFSGANRILDPGCGSGLLALMAAQRNRQAEITGLEIDDGAVAAAEWNFARSPWSDRLRVEKCDVTQLLVESTAPLYDMVVSNPPYFANGLQSPDKDRARARHATIDPEAATANGAGFGPVMCVEIAARALRDGGRLAMVTPADCEADVMFAAAMHRLSPLRVCRVRTTAAKAPKRMLWEMVKADCRCKYSELILRHSGDYSDEYLRLTEDFYLFLH